MFKIIEFTAHRVPVSLSVTVPFWIILPVVLSNRASALSVDEAGQTTSPKLPPPHPTCMTCLLIPFDIDLLY